MGTTTLAAGSTTAAATTPKKCAADQFVSDNACVKCPELYSCDGTAKVTKKKTTCLAGHTEKCLTCPADHDCANGVATIDGKKAAEKAAATTTVPAATTTVPAATTIAKMGNSNTLSVALPLCLTALIVMFK